LGICATQLPLNDNCWSCTGGKIEVDLSLAPELDQPGSGLRLEGKECPQRILLIYGDDCQFHAFHNKCEHGGRRLDPVPSEEKVQCCSIGKSTYDYEGKIMSGPAGEPVKTYPVELVEGKLTIDLS
jgi:nitrite reductase/ring-hydroxylating ferredoxin subunit